MVQYLLLLGGQGHSFIVWLLSAKRNFWVSSFGIFANAHYGLKGFVASCVKNEQAISERFSWIQVDHALTKNVDKLETVAKIRKRERSISADSNVSQISRHSVLLLSFNDSLDSFGKPVASHRGIGQNQGRAFLLQPFRATASQRAALALISWSITSLFSPISTNFRIWNEGMKKSVRRKVRQWGPSFIRQISRWLSIPQLQPPCISWHWSWLLSWDSATHRSFWS